MYVYGIDVLFIFRHVLDLALQEKEKKSDKMMNEKFIVIDKKQNLVLS